MKKETSIAIIFGIVFGAVIAVFIILKNKDFQLQKSKTIAPDIKTKSKTNPNLINANLLEIVIPTDGMIVNKNLVTIKGKLTQKSLLIVQSPLKDYVKEIDKGDFNFDFSLALGENVINISAYSKDPIIRNQEKQIKVYFLDQL